MVVKEKVVNEMQEVKEMIDTLVNNGRKALQALESFTQEQIDNIVHEMALAGVDQHMPLAKLAVEETGRGVYEDKCIKNIFATEYIWHSIKKDKTVGIIHEDPHEEIIEIAEPVGVVAGVTPVTNPTSTTMFKALIAIKREINYFRISSFSTKLFCCSRENSIRCSGEGGAPKHCIQWIEKPSVEATKQLMNHEGVALVLATGGAGMVKSAYSTGKPALGVGPGNVPCYIEKSAHIKRAVNDLILSKTFDNGMICASEQAIIVDKEIYDDVKTEMITNDCYFVTEEERRKLEKLVINENTCAVNSDIVGKSAQYIAELVGITVPKNTKMLVAEIQGIGAAYPLSREKLSPVLACVKANSLEEGFTYCEEMLNLGGLGHSAVIHSVNKEVQKQFGLRMKACRLIVNAPSSQGGIGDIYNGFIPSLTLGCGSYGKTRFLKM